MFEQLKELICNYVEVDADSITLESRFSDDLGFNSFDFLSMLGEAEDIFDMDINEGEAGSCKTVNELLKYLEDNK